MELNEKYKQGIDCTIVILSYNTKDVTFECLKRVEISRQYFSRKLQKKADIVVVENGSKDGSLEMIKENYPEVKLIALEKNVGYPRGNNLAMEKVTSPYILLINSDTYLKEETLAQAYEYMEENLACDVLSARLVYLDGSFQAFSGFLPTPFRSIRWSFLIESIPVINKLIKPLYQYDKSFYKEEKQFDWVTTGFFFMRKKVYEVTGGFDERLFLYMEDVEWCQRIKEKGFKIFYLPSLVVIHLGGFSAKKLPSEELLRRHVEGVRHFHSVHYPKTLDLVMFCFKIGMIIRAIAYTIIIDLAKARIYWSVVFSGKKRI